MRIGGVVPPFEFPSGQVKPLSARQAQALQLSKAANASRDRALHVGPAEAQASQLA